MAIDRDQDALRRDFQPPSDALENSDVRLMGYKPVDVLHAEAELAEHLAGRRGQLVDGVPEDLAPVHAQMPGGAGGGRAAVDVQVVVVAAIRT